MNDDRKQQPDNHPNLLISWKIPPVATAGSQHLATLRAGLPSRTKPVSVVPYGDVILKGMATERTCALVVTAQKKSPLVFY